MSMHVRPILTALLRNRTGAVLVAFQIAISLAVLANSVYIVKQRMDRINEPSGLDLGNMFVVMSQGFSSAFNFRETMTEDLNYLRSMDGVIAVTPSSHAPLSGTVFDSLITTNPDGMSNRKDVDYYEVDEHAIAAFGVRLIAGRNFTQSEILPPLDSNTASQFVPSVIVTRRFAQDLFGDESALGKTIYAQADQPATIIGVIDHMQGGRVDLSYSGRVMLLPRLPGDLYGFGPFYIVRVEPGQLDRVMRTVEEHMTKSNPNRIIEWVRPMTYFSGRTYRADRNISIFLCGVTVLLLIVTSLGIFGLATFNVSTRTKQIGTRRALGARRLDIVQYFMIENWMVTTSGIVIGCALALAAGYQLSLHYSLPRLDLYYLVGGILVLWTLGLAAAWRPSRRAAGISPAIATRTV
jgi:putative ABC transport system permease protein